jgi:hypothetical protein
MIDCRLQIQFIQLIRGGKSDIQILAERTKAEWTTAKWTTESTTVRGKCRSIDFDFRVAEERKKNTK